MGRTLRRGHRLQHMAEYTRRAYITTAYPSPKATSIAASVKGERRRRNKAARAARRTNRGA